MFLKRPWFERGVGQKLALLLRAGDLTGDIPQQPHPNLGKEELLENYPAVLRQFLTMRAKDPGSASGTLPNFVTGNEIHNDVSPRHETELRLPLPGMEPKAEVSSADSSKSGPANPGAVSVALFDVHLDVKRDVWIGDIEISTRDAYMPFVRLGLCACQLQSLQGVELSQPIALWTQVPPERTAIVLQSHEKPGKLHITIDGSGYRGKNPGIVLENFKSLVDRPWLAVKFATRRRGSGAGWQVMDDVDEIRVQSGDNAGRSPKLFDFFVNLPAQVVAGDHQNGSFEYRVELEEIEYSAADHFNTSEENDSLSVIEVIQVSEDGLSAIIRQRTVVVFLFPSKK